MKIVTKGEKKTVRFAAVTKAPSLVIIWSGYSLEGVPLKKASKPSYRMVGRDDITGRGCVGQQGSVEEPVCVAASASAATVRGNQRSILPV